MAMGSRGARGGDELDAFSRRARRLLRWRPGQRAHIKRQFAKRMRKAARLTRPGVQ